MLAGLQEACAEMGKGRYGGTIGEADNDFMSGGGHIGTRSCGAKEMTTAARVGDGAMGRVVGNERTN